MGKELIYGKNILKRWCKDFNLPIKIYKEPYFSYLVDLYDGYLNTKEKFGLLEEALERFDNGEEFLCYCNKVRDEIINTIKENIAYQEFNVSDMNKYNIDSKYPKGNIYKESNVGKHFISIDLKKANFQALKHINKDIVLGAKSYSEFIHEFTDIDYIAESKYFRQVIFGNLNPKRQTKVERFLIEQIINVLLEKNLCKEEDIRMASTDELVIEVQKDDITKAFINDLTEYYLKDLNLDVKVEFFRLDSIYGKGFVKEFVFNNGYKLSGVSVDYFPQVFKKYNHLELNDKDLTFFYDGHLSRFLNHLFGE